MNRSRPIAAVVALGTALALVACGSDEGPDDPRQAVAPTVQESDTAGSNGDPNGPSTNTTPDPTVTAEGSGAGPEEVVIPAAEDDLAFTRREVTASAGMLRLTMGNPSDTEHNIAVDRPRKVVGPVVGKGETSRITVDFPPGRYEYYCSVPGHRQAGMVGTLIVR